MNKELFLLSKYQICPKCKRDKSYPLGPRNEPISRGIFPINMRCPECENIFELDLNKNGVNDLNNSIISQINYIEKLADEINFSLMESEVNIFAKAISIGAILPFDF